MIEQQYRPEDKLLQKRNTKQRGYFEANLVLIEDEPFELFEISYRYLTIKNSQFQKFMKQVILLKKYELVDNQLPRILQSDQKAKFFGLHHRDIIRKREIAE